MALQKKQLGGSSLSLCTRGVAEQSSVIRAFVKNGELFV